MKVALARADLARATAALARVVERRNTIPILSNLLLATKDGTALTITGTDLDLTLAVTIPAEVQTPGRVTVPAAILADWTRKLPDGAQVSFEQETDKVPAVLRSGRSRTNLQTLPAEDFPDMQAGDMPVAFALPGTALAGLLEAVEFAMSSEETRYYLNGIYLHTIEVDGEAMLRAVATDGHRLARAEMPAPAGSAGLNGVILPRKTVGEILRMCREAKDAEVAVEISPSKVTIEAGGARLLSKLIDGTFPDYARVIPTENDTIATLEAGDLARAVDRVATISAERGRAVKLELAEGRLVLTVNNPDSGLATEEVDAIYDAAPLTIGFNARYVGDILKVLDADTVELALDNPGSPSIWRSPADRTRLYVLMPMRV